MAKRKRPGDGKPRHKRSEDQRNLDRMRIQYFRLRGRKGHQEIADLINAERPEAEHISRQVVTYELGVARRNWARYAAGGYHVWLGEWLQEMYLAIAELWDAWEESKRPRRTQTIREEPRFQRGKDGEEPVVVLTEDGPVHEHTPKSRERFQEPRHGDPRIMGHILAALKEIRQALGLGDPDLWRVATGTLADPREQADAAAVLEARRAEVVAGVEGHLQIAGLAGDIALAEATLASQPRTRIQYLEKSIRASQAVARATAGPASGGTAPASIEVVVRRVTVEASEG